MILKKLTISLSLFICVGCFQSKDVKAEAETGFSAGDTTSQTQTANTGNDIANAKIVAHQMLDNKKQLMAVIPLPANWRVNNGGGNTFVSGPNGIHVYAIPMRTFMYSNDPYFQQSAAQTGNKMRQFVPIDRLVQQELLPIAKKEGSKFIRQYNAPEIAASDKSFSDMLFKTGPIDQRFSAAVTEWTDKDGDPYLIVLHQNGTFMDNMVTWSYYGHILEAPKASYESAKKVLLAGLAGTQYNPRYVDAYNQQESQKAGAGWAAHNSRMQQNQRNFDTWQQNHASKTAAINDASMAAYNSRNAASDKSHNRFMNYIKDENTVIQAGTGQKYQVESGANQYWMNSEGKYVKSNDPNYDPNRDPAYNNSEWQQTQMQD
ncbi:MAG TPA: hypothetical protein VF676_13530 [Flavobacterium sp.]|jgi:hypothetical protein